MRGDAATAAATDEADAMSDDDSVLDDNSTNSYEWVNTQAGMAGAYHGAWVLSTINCLVDWHYAKQVFGE